MTYLEKLEAWFQNAKTAGLVSDIKFFPIDPNTTSVEEFAKAVYLTLTGEMADYYS